MTASPPEDVIARMKSILGPDGWSDDPDRLAPKLVEWRDRWRGHTPLLALPNSTEQVSRVVTLCAEAGVAITPQGGNTGLVGGQIPQGEILLSTERLRAIRAVNSGDDVMVAEAGVILETAHEAALAVGRRFPLDLASGGSATLGGLVSTNAGGTAVLRYGNMRDLVLGVEVVMPDGRIWNGLKRLRKDNTGYDLKQLMIGGEGTLGVVTAVAVKLFPILTSRAVAVAGLSSVAVASEFLKVAKSAIGLDIEAFELICRLGMELAVRNLPGARDPLSTPSPLYVLIEIASAQPGAAESAMERLLASAAEAALIGDAVVAQNEAQAKAFWALREGQSAAQKSQGAAWKHDVSVPLSRIPEFIDTATARLEAKFPGVRIDAFGHMGDGNIHFDVLSAVSGDQADHAAARDKGARIVHDLAVEMGGSISAEHGLGSMKTAEAAGYKSAVELDVLRAVRAAIDPGRIMNPRVLF